MAKHILTFSLLSLMMLAAFGQQTVGLFLHDTSSYEGYTLFAPTGYTQTYLIDNCGREVNSWSSNKRPGLSAYLLEDGSLLRTANIGSSRFTSGGSGGRVDRWDWDSNLLWHFEYASDSFHQHHDVEYLPNGNVLILAWELRSRAASIAAGRDSSYLLNELWPEHIIEVEPLSDSGGLVIWEWHLWDHLIQDHDSSKANFGVLADHPELVDLNFHRQNTPDIIHANGIDYNAKLDQIVISSRNYSELWVIDHGTTTAEAASHSGGRYGKGGDLLYRWGNPMAYDRGVPNDQKLYRQHDAHWIPDSLPGGGDIMVFNNGQGRKGGNFSSVDVLTPPVDSAGFYTLSGLDAFGPQVLSWSYQAPDLFSFFSGNVSGAQRLPNGNTLICEGSWGRLFEVETDGSMVWEYINPVSIGGPISQGTSANGLSVFRTYRYGSDYAGLNGKDLSAGGRIEVNPLPLSGICSRSSIDIENEQKMLVFPNPFNHQLQVLNPNPYPVKMTITDIMGRTSHFFYLKNELILNTENWPAGLYFLQIEGQKTAVKLLKR